MATIKNFPILRLEIKVFHDASWGLDFVMSCEGV